MGFKAGTRLRAQNSACEVIIVKGWDSDTALLCAGLEMVTAPADSATPRVSDGPMIDLGKRYTDDSDEIELLCTKQGFGPLSFNGHGLSLKAAKALPASD